MPAGRGVAGADDRDGGQGQHGGVALDREQRRRAGDAAQQRRCQPRRPRQAGAKRAAASISACAASAGRGAAPRGRRRGERAPAAHRALLAEPKRLIRVAKVCGPTLSGADQAKPGEPPLAVRADACQTGAPVIAAADPLIGAGDQPRDVGAVLPEDEQRHQREQHRAVARAVDEPHGERRPRPSQQRRARSSGGQRDEEPDGGEDQRDLPGESGEHAEWWRRPCRPEAEPDGEEVAEEGAEAGERPRSGPTGRRPAHGGRALQHVEQEDWRRRAYCVRSTLVAPMLPEPIWRDRPARRRG